MTATNNTRKTLHNCFIKLVCNDKCNSFRSGEPKLVIILGRGFDFGSGIWSKAGQTNARQA